MMRKYKYYWVILTLLVTVVGCAYVESYREGYAYAKQYRVYPDECQVANHGPIAGKFRQLGCVHFTSAHKDYLFEPKADIGFCQTHLCLDSQFYREGYEWAATHPITSLSQCGDAAYLYPSTNEHLTYLGCMAYFKEYPEKIIPEPKDDPALVRTSPEGLVPITDDY